MPSGEHLVWPGPGEQRRNCISYIHLGASKTTQLKPRWLLGNWEGGLHGSGKSKAKQDGSNNRHPFSWSPPAWKAAPSEKSTSPSLLVLHVISLWTDIWCSKPKGAGNHLAMSPRWMLLKSRAGLEPFHRLELVCVCQTLLSTWVIQHLGVLGGVSREATNSKYNLQSTQVMPGSGAKTEKVWKEQDVSSSRWHIK